MRKHNIFKKGNSASTFTSMTLLDENKRWQTTAANQFAKPNCNNKHSDKRSNKLSTYAWALLTPLLALQAPQSVADVDEPPVNSFLADSAWPMSHRTPYVQGSSSLMGPTSAAQLKKPAYRSSGLVNITMAMSALYLQQQVH